MKVRFKYKHFVFVTLSLVLFFQSCEKFLETPPENSRTKEEFWSNKGDVESAVIGAYNGLQGCLWKFFVWGEIRGELLEMRLGANELENFVDLEIDYNNWLCKWNEMYSAINKINTVLKYAPLAEEQDNTFSKKELNEYLGECLTLRALLYFYLARAYIEFPYITEPSDNDQQDYNVDPKPNDEVLDLIIEDLLAAENMVKVEYDDQYFTEKGIQSSPLISAYRKGRVSRPVVWALLADVYLTKGEFEKVVMYSDSLINLPNTGLELYNDWHEKLFAQGNSMIESIFELQYSETYDQKSGIASWFIQSLGDGRTNFINRRNAVTQTYKLWEGENALSPSEVDHRGIDGQYLKNNPSIVWKWAGLNDTEQRNITSEDANWIFYRLADIFLMKAEALNRLQRKDEAIETLNIVRIRATTKNYATKTNPIIANSENELEELILDERGRELAAEGKRWFDLVRIAKRQANYEIIGKRIAEARSVGNEQSLWKGKVFDPLSWYLPIHKEELDLNKKLQQNPYYTNR